MALNEFAEFPGLRLPVRSFVEPEEITAQDIEEAAAEIRELWRLGKGPIADLVLAAEGAGILVAREITGIAQIEGLSSWSPELERPLVLLSADKANSYRSRFDLAHEVAHLVLHRHVERTTDHARHKLLEVQAHRFAGALLLPAESFAADVRTPVSLDDLILLKRRWGVSVAAMVMRLKALMIIDADECQQLQKRISWRWGRKAEPGDEDRAREAPRLLRRTIDLLAEHNIMPRSAISGHMGLSDMDIEYLASLPAGYLRASSSVVELARLRKPAPEEASASPNDAGTVVPFKRI